MEAICSSKTLTTAYDIIHAYLFGGGCGGGGGSSSSNNSRSSSSHIVVVVVVHHCQNPKQYCIFFLPYHMLEVVNFRTGNYESGVASNE